MTIPLHKQGLSTLLTHYREGDNPANAHITPIFQTSAFIFPDVKTGADIFAGSNKGFSYTRVDNPNTRQLAAKIAMLEGLDLIHENPTQSVEDLVVGRVYGSGMAAISTAVFACLEAGSTVITQEILYGNAYNLMAKILPLYGIHVIWVDGFETGNWEAAFHAHPEVDLVYLETPANPTLDVVDLEMIATFAKQNNARVVADNTFATPFCQRPLTLGADIVAHSTTKYLSGHGQIIGGALVSSDPEFFNPHKNRSFLMSKVLGGAASPMDAWLTNIGLKTFELRMQRHLENTNRVVNWLKDRPEISQVYYPGLEAHPGHEIARKQMPGGYGAMISFEMKGGFQDSVKLMESLQVITLAVSLGNVDSLIQHPASMTHAAVPPEERAAVGITPSLIRLSVGIENVDDIIADLEQGLNSV